MAHLAWFINMVYFTKLIKKIFYCLILQIFSEKSPINHRPGIDDIILLVTDGEPVAYGRSEFTVVDDTLVEADKLKAKGVRIVGVRIARVYVDLTVLKQIATDGQTLETTFDDIGNTIDKIVEGFCPQTTTGMISLIPLFSSSFHGTDYCFNFSWKDIILFHK